VKRAVEGGVHDHHVDEDGYQANAAVEPPG
jgi:hypothetical protein